MPDDDNKSLSVVAPSLPVTITQAKELVASQPDWLVGYDRTADDTEEFLATLTAHAHARVWVNLEGTDSDVERGSEMWAALVADETLRLLRNISTVTDVARAAMAAEIARRHLYDKCFGNYDSLATMLLSVAEDSNAASQVSDLTSVAEVIIPFLRSHQDYCECDHREADHGSGCALCDCDGFAGPPNPREFWVPGNWNKLRVGIPLMRATIEDTRSVGEKVEGLRTVVDTFTNPKASRAELRKTLRLRQPDPIEYTLKRVLPPGKDPPNEEIKWRLTFPALDRTQRAMILKGLGLRLKQIQEIEP